MPIATTAYDCEIYYEYHGSGVPLLLISGTGHDHTFWSGQLPLLSQHYQCFVFDNRGVGQSSTPEPGYSLSDMADRSNQSPRGHADAYVFCWRR